MASAASSLLSWAGFPGWPPWGQASCWLRWAPNCRGQVSSPLTALGKSPVGGMAWAGTTVATVQPTSRPCPGVTGPGPGEDGHGVIAAGWGRAHAVT